MMACPFLCVFPIVLDCMELPLHHLSRPVYGLPAEVCPHRCDPIGEGSIDLVDHPCEDLLSACVYIFSLSNVLLGYGKQGRSYPQKGLALTHNGFPLSLHCFPHRAHATGVRPGWNQSVVTVWPSKVRA